MLSFTFLLGGVNGSKELHDDLDLLIEPDVQTNNSSDSTIQTGVAMKGDFGRKRGRPNGIYLALRLLRGCVLAGD
jgi:hypothetical protein